MSETVNQNRPGFYKLNEIVLEACDAIGTRNDYDRAYSAAVYILRDLTVHVMGDYAIQRTKLDVEMGRAYFPDDYVGYIQLGVIENGNLVNLGHNDRMIEPIPDACGNTGQVTGGDPRDLGQNGHNTPPDYYRDQYQNGIYRKPLGNGGGWNRRGYYKPEIREGYFAFNSDYPYDYVILDYVTSGFSPTRDNLIHTYFVNAMVTGIIARMVKLQAINETKMRPISGSWNQDWLIEKRKAALNVNANPLYETMDEIRKTNTMARKS